MKITCSRTMGMGRYRGL